MSNSHGSDMGEVLSFGAREVRRFDGHAGRNRNFYYALMPPRDDWPSADVLPMSNPTEGVTP